MKIRGCVAVITGGASGLGLASAHALREAGASIVIADLPGSAGKSIADDYGSGAVFAPTDVTDSEQVEAALDAAAAMGDLRIVVNCAGIGTGVRTVGKNGAAPLDHFVRTVTTNLVGTYNVTRLGAARMAALEERAGERGVVVNTASVAAFDGQIGQVAYSASKAGVAGMTLPLARDLAVLKIRVLTIAPGLFRTPLFATVPQDAIASLEAQVPHPARLGEPSEYAALVRHIVENPMLNAETIRLDGGIRMAPR
jgi:NAD(P)-dependent dehydrogenase (short-subunit alcohol dehydrogenase family)